MEVDSNDELREMFETTWPKALQRLKELAEKQEELSRKKNLKSKIRVAPGRRKMKK